MAIHEIWQSINPTTANEILCRVQDCNKKLYRSTLELMSKQMRQRPNRVLEMPKIDRHTLWGHILAHPQLENVAFNVLSAWLVDAHSDLLCAWLDCLGIPHDEQGFFSAQKLPEPSVDVLSASISKLIEKYDPVLVSRYLRVFNSIDSVQWPSLDALIQADTRLILPEAE